MKKQFSIVVIAIVLISGFGAVVINKNAALATSVETQEALSMVFPSLQIEEKNDEYLQLTFDGETTYLANPGQPMLPKYVKTIELGFGVKSINIDFTAKNVHEVEVEKEIKPTPQFLDLASIETVLSEDNFKDAAVYNSDVFYPSGWYNYDVRCGLNADNQIVTTLTLQCYPVRYNPVSDLLMVMDSADVVVTYQEPEIPMLSNLGNYDLVIIAPDEFTNDLQVLADHKNSYGVQTIIKTTTEIYNEYSGRDKPEQIKYFIKYALEEFGVKYILLVGGLKSTIWGVARDDPNQGSKDWLVPVRYNNIHDNPKYPLTADDHTHDPGIISDLYYADIYEAGGGFSSWDPNGDGIIAAWDFPEENIENDTGIDMMPDVCVGRLACRNTDEVRIMVEKIINYEKNTYSQDWFKRITTISGDGFLDQTDLDIQWDTKGLLNGEYTIYAQSKNIDDVSGEIDTVTVELDKNAASSISFNHDDHLRLTSYPSPPMAEITSPSNGDVLGNTDYYYEPAENEAYCNEFLGWGNVEYTDEVMHIRGKSYDPRPYGVQTDLHVWIKNKNDDIIFDHTVEGLEMYFEGEWVCGERYLNGAGGALCYMPSEFERNLLLTSNGKLVGQDDVIDAFNEGNGFIFFNGHGSPTSWGNHYAGVPGNRANSDFTGLATVAIFKAPPFLPMNKLKNDDEPSIVLVGGCHNSQFNVSLIATLLRLPGMWSYVPTPECWSWYLTSLSKRGAIATIGNTGLGYGVIGKECTSIGLDSGICIEFFKQYSQGYDMLGEAYKQTQINYIQDFDMTLQEHAKTLQQWVLLGDPSLKIGGYPPSSQADVKIINEPVADSGMPVTFQAVKVQGANPESYEWSLDTTGDGVFDTFATGQTIQEQWSNPGVYWVEVKAIYDDEEVTSLSIVEIENDLPNIPTITGPESLQPGQIYSYNIRCSDPNNDTLEYVIDWGDGIYDVIKQDDSTTVTHKWGKKGAYDITVNAIDENGGWNFNTISVSVSTAKDKSRLHNTALVQILLRLFERYPGLLNFLNNIG